VITRLIFGALLAAGGVLWAQPKLSIERMEFHQYEDGPVLTGGYEFLPGETVWFSSRIGGYQTRKSDDDQFVKIAWQMKVSDPDGVLIDKAKSGRIEDRLTPEDKEWRPKFLATFQIPSFGFGGTYKVEVAVKDELSNAEISRVLELPVKGPAPFRAESLLVRNFRFLRNENDTLPLQPPVYRPGTMLWAKFDIAGYKLGANNRLDVEYGLVVLGPDGKQLFSQPEAAGDAKESFYPQRWVPGALSLNLDPNVGKATYTLVVIVRDKLAGETTELRQPFEVE